MIDIRTPFPEDWLALAWQWFNEFPDANRDDFGPDSFDAFYLDMKERLTLDRTWGVLKDGLPCGYIGLSLPAPGLAVLHGICFAKGHLDRREKRMVVSRILDDLFAQGFHKVSATYFAHNQKIARFLQDLGFHIEGHLLEQTKQHGTWIDMELVGRLKE